MIAFEVSDMTCGHCVRTITQALKSTDREAEVTIDLAKHLVVVEPTKANAQDLSDAIADAGYTPVRAGAPAAAAPPSSRWSCCGTCG